MSDRSTLRYYLRGEMIRAWLASEGDLDRAVQRVAGGPDLEGEVHRKMALFMESVGEMACMCESEDELQQQLQERFRKLPGDYEPVLKELGDRTWQQTR